VHKSSIMVKELKLIEKLCNMNLGMQLGLDHIWCSVLKVTNELLEEIREEQGNDAELQ